jgi:splicing factor 3A subunit 2
MVQILVRNTLQNNESGVGQPVVDEDEFICFDYESNQSINDLFLDITSEYPSLSSQEYSLYYSNGLYLPPPLIYDASLLVSDYFQEDGIFLEIRLPLNGGIDFQHREHGKTGSGGQLSESQAALERKERLRKLALETIDITKDPYFMRNHLGTFECKLCLTLHPNEGNYLAHTQGKRHQYNLGRRAAMEAKNAAPRTIVIKEAPKKRFLKIGRPGYKITKSRDLLTRQRSIMFEIDFPEVDITTSQPRHRFMSAYEQKLEPPDKNYQYLLIACDPYETIGFKIPNHTIDKREGRFITKWDTETKKFIVQLYFIDSNTII